MAKFRQVHVEFWQDGFVLDLTPEEKYFYIYLMTNSKTSQCGIYELPKRIIETDTGYNRETVEKLLQRFVDYGKIMYDNKTKEIMILKWIKYNAIKSPKVISCIKKELESVKNKHFIRIFINMCKQYGYRIDTLSIDLGEEEEREEEKEREKEEEQHQERENECVGVVAIQFYENNYGFLNSFITENLIKWCEDLSDELVIESMKISLKNQKPFSYAEGILRNWAAQNVKTLHDVKALDNKAKNKEGKNDGNSQYDDLF